MAPGALSSVLLRSQRPSTASGVVGVVASVGVATAAIYPLKQVTPVLSLNVLYVLAVVVVSTFWGLAFGVATSLLSAAAFNFFHLPPPGRFALADERDWAALVALVVVAVATGLVADAARSRGLEAERRRKEADLAAELARLLLGSADVKDALDPAGERLAAALGAPSARIELRGEEPARDVLEDGGSVRFELRDAQSAMGALVVQGVLTSAEREHVRERLLPPLESVLAGALHRAELEAEVVETAALRRSDELKTAVLRSVSHDLRTPLAAILMAGDALNAEHPTSENVSEVREQVLAAATRLGHVIEKMLDLSLLESGRAEPRQVWYSIDEVLHEAIAQIEAPEVEFALSIDRELPLLQGDPAQLERAFANVLENAARYCDRQPVTVRAREVRGRIRILIVDQGPGIAAADHERIFLPFYRSGERPSHNSGSGLGLAITRGFLDLNGGRIRVESVPGQGTTFVVEFTIGARPPDAVAAVPGHPAAV